MVSSLKIKFIHTHDWILHFKYGDQLRETTVHTCNTSATLHRHHNKMLVHLNFSCLTHFSLFNYQCIPQTYPSYHIYVKNIVRNATHVKSELSKLFKHADDIIHINIYLVHHPYKWMFLFTIAFQMWRVRWDEP